MDEGLRAMITVARSTGGGEEKPRLQTYRVPVQEKMTILQALEYIYENLDASVGFNRYCCGVQYCNSCRMLINGRPAHACLTMAETGDYLLEPLPGHQVIRDLIVDWSGAAGDRDTDAGHGSE